MRTRIVFLILLSCTTLNGTVSAISFYAEVQRLEKRIQSKEISAADKYKTLVELGQLLQLAGELERASQVWLTAAAVDPSNGDEARLKAAACFIAIGDMDEAYSALHLISTRDALVQFRVRCLKAYVETYQNKNTKSFEALLSDPQSAADRPALYYLLGKVSGMSGYFTKLLEEYPHSLEARIVKREQVQPAYTALWFFYPDWEGVAVEERKKESSIAQVGLFENEGNARLMAQRLSEAGFGSATVIRRTINKKEYWAVGVTPDADVRKTIAALKAKGFDAFLVTP
ncbi:MAG: SPOR domain-containing protein [Spirochaetaceae bacterium]|nr:SPOR domain-containing protein [Spirochaetaceae bacterium]